MPRPFCSILLALLVLAGVSTGLLALTADDLKPLAEDDFDAKSLKAFAARYPKAQHFVVAQDVDRAYTKHFDSLEVRFSSLNAFVERVEGEFGPDQF